MKTHPRSGQLKVNFNRSNKRLLKRQIFTFLLFFIAISIFSLANAQTIDIIGKGVLGNTSANLPLTNLSNIDRIDVGATYKELGYTTPSLTTVQFFDNDEGPFGNYKTEPDLIVKHFSYPSYGATLGYFEATFNTFLDGGLNATIETAAIDKVHGFYAYVYRNDTEASYISYASTETSFHFLNGSADPYVYTIPINTDSSSRNIKVKIPISELDDGMVRKAIVDITAGSVTEHVEVFTYNLGESFFLMEYVLADVPGDVNEVSVSVYSPSQLVGEDPGHSFFVNGIVIDVDKVYEPIELEVCIKDLGNDLYSATFGYHNPNAVEITLDEGSSLINHNTGSNTSYEQNGILTFEPGTVENVFSRQFMKGENVEWTVQSSNSESRTAQASQNSAICTVEKGGIIFPLYDQGDGKTDVVLGLDLNALAAGNAGLVPSPLIYQIKDNQKVLVEVIPQANQLQTVLSLLQNNYDLLYNTDPSLTDFIISPAQIVTDGLSTIDVYFPISSLLDLNNFSQQINFVRVLSPTLINTGIVTSQGDGAQRTDLVRDSFRIISDGEVAPVDGAGIKIGVLSDSFNTQPFTGKSKAEVDVENGDLPGLLNPNGYLSEVEVLKEFPFGEGFDEGRAMLQIVHDVAPGADLAFHTGVVSPRDFELGVKALQDAGCTVIVDDITFPAEPFFGQGKIAQAIQDFTNIPGNSYITSAGNFSDNGYQSIFNASTEIPQTNFLSEGSSQKAHVFGSNSDGSQDIIQKISVVPGIYMLVLQWDEELASQENSLGATDDLDFYLVDEEGRLIVGNNRINDQGDPTEIMFFQATGTGEANIMITNASTNPSPNLPFRFIAFRSAGLEFLEYAGAPTVSGHAMTPEAITVGAVDYRVALNPTSQVFSSKAGNLSDMSSTEVDLSAPDGVNTNVNSIGQDIEGDGFTNFFGTSAAAPHVAGAMALLQAAKASWYPEGLSITDIDLFKQNAVIFGQVELAGAGLIDANNAFKQIATQTAKLIQLIPEEGKIPSADSFVVTITGKFFPESETVSVGGEDVPAFMVLFNGVEIEAVLVSDTEITANIEPFVGNPPLIVTTTGISPGGTDGGDSDPIFFFDGKIALNVKADDVDVLFGDAVEFSFSVEGLEDGVTFESLGLPQIVFTSPAVFPYPDVNNYIITPEFETPLTEEQLELFQVNFVNGILNVAKKDLVVKPVDLMYTYGDAINIVLDFSYDTAGIEDNADFLANLNASYESSFFPENTLALINKFRPIVNDYDILDLLNQGSWISSESTIQNKFRPIVNGMNVIDLDVENFTNYIDAASDGTTNKFRPIVNKFRAIVNSEELFNGNVELAIENKFRPIVNASDIGDENDQNNYQSVFAIVDVNEDDDPSSTDDISIAKFYSMNLITGLDVTSEEEHYIFPGAFLAPIAANFNITYESGRLIILPASLQVSTSDLEINEGESIDMSLIQSTITGFEYDDTIETVFPDGIPYLFVNSDGTEYEVGDIGQFDIKIIAPANYTIEYTTVGKLNVVEVNELEYCDSKQKKVYICHNGNTICVSINAIDSHLNNHEGDHLGQCTGAHNNSQDDEDSSYKIYPNPVYNVLKIEPTVQREITVEIFNIYGVTYYHKIVKKKKSKQVNINMSSYPKGLYIVRIKNDSNEDTYNIVKN